MSRKKDVFSEAIVGLFMLAVLALLVYFTIVISGVDVLQGRRKVRVAIEFSEVGGLKDHDNVMFRGTKVGTVDKVLLSPTNLTVVAEIDDEVVLREGYRIAVCNLSMLGGNYLLLEEGKGAVLPLEGTVFKGEKPSDWMRDVSNIAKNLNEFTSGGELKNIVANFEATGEKASAIADKALAIVDRVERGEGTVGKLLSSDDTVYNDLKTAMGDLTEIAQRLKRGEGTLGKLLSEDETMYNELMATLKNASAISQDLRDGKGLAGRLLKDEDPIYGNVDAAIASFRKACESVDAKETLESANRLLASLNEAADRINRGEGTMGKLMKDDELYNEINGLTKDVRQVIDNFRDTTPISTFGSLIMGGL